MKNTTYDKIIIHNLDKIPKGLNYSNSYEISELGEYELKNLSGFNIDEIWYWYARSDYEGSGKMLLRRKNLYEVLDLGHCSCYGPLVRFNKLDWKKLDKIKMTNEFSKEIKDLFELAIRKLKNGCSCKKKLSGSLIQRIKDWIRDFDLTQPGNVIVDEDTFEGSAYFIMQSILGENKNE